MPYRRDSADPKLNRGQCRPPLRSPPVAFQPRAVHDNGTVTELTIWHNPRCSKSRRTLELIKDRGLEPIIVEYLSAPPTADELRETLKALDLEPRELMRKTEPVYRELGLDDHSLSDDELVAVMVAHPILIERPVVLVGERAILGRPPENVLALLG